MNPVFRPLRELADAVRERRVSPVALAETFLETVDYPGSDGVPIARAPARLSHGSAETLLRPPLLGEHDDQVLTELGFNPEEIRSLRQDGIISA